MNAWRLDYDYAQRMLLDNPGRGHGLWTGRWEGIASVFDHRHLAGECSGELGINALATYHPAYERGTSAGTYESYCMACTRPYFDCQSKDSSEVAVVS